MSRRSARDAGTPLSGARVPAVVLVLVVPAVLAPVVSVAQATTAIGPYAAYALDGGAANAPPGTIVGLQATVAGSGIGARLGAATALGAGNGSSVGSGTSNWMADGDLLLLPQALGRRSASSTPMVYGLAGVGTSSVGGASPTNTWSYGAGLLIPFGALELSAESRVRTPFDASTGGAWHEMRVGVALRFGGVSSGRTRSTVRPPGRVPSGGGVVVGSASAARVLSTADRYLGVPYKWGGTTPDGFDCSGYVQYVFAHNGVELPRTSREQAQVGLALPASWNAVQPGDLVMFAEPGEAISHVAIYAGNRRIIHSSSSRGGVGYDDLDTRRGQWFLQRMVAARRVLGADRSLVQSLMRTWSAAEAKLDPPDHAPRP